MWETIKNNVLLKTIVVIILGVLGFGLAFNIMFGRNIGMMGEGMAGGYSLESALAYILMILVKLLLIAIVLAALTAVYKYGKKYLFEGGEIKLLVPVKNDPVIKTVSIIIVSVLVIALIVMLFGNMFGGFGAAPYYNYYMRASGGFGIASLLTFLVKLLLVISVVGLIASVILYIFQNPTMLGNIRAACTVGKTESSNACSKCGMALKSGWKCCPNCGEEMQGHESNESAPIIDAFDTEERDQMQTAADEETARVEIKEEIKDELKEELKEEIKEDLASNEGTDVYDKLYSSTTEDAIDNTKLIKNKKKHNKR